MKNRWDEAEASATGGGLLDMRVYTSRLLGMEEDLVLHGGGNTSVKIRETDPFGEEIDVLYVKGSGWDLATIESGGFAPVKMDALLSMAKLETLSDPDMVKYQRTAMTDPSAPNPSVEAILHAIIPYVFVDHTHADAVVAVSNTPRGEERIRSIYGDRVLIVPYVMPGFILARKIYEMTRGLDWDGIKGIVLMNHGIFTFSDDASTSYDKMIALVSEAEDHLRAHNAFVTPADADKADTDALAMAALRRSVSSARGAAVLLHADNSPEALAYSRRPDLQTISQRGPLTPDHIIRTKRVPLILDGGEGSELDKSVNSFVGDYCRYFDSNTDGKLTCLDPAPRWAVWPGRGIFSFGNSLQEIRIISDIGRHTIKAVQQAEMLEKWQALPEKDLFDMEYWVLEQAKLAKGGKARAFQGKVALVTGAASGIGRACVRKLLEEGAVVAALDIQTWEGTEGSVFPILCDVTDKASVLRAVGDTVCRFGGLDILISNAGIFPKSVTVREMDDDTWNRSLSVNLTAHRMLITAAIPFLELGIDPAIVIIGSKNVPAPGPGAGAYSVAKAGLTQLARVASLELGAKGIRVNVIHPNAVYDTGIWTDDVLRARAAHYGMSVEEYKTNNILKREVTSSDVAAVAAALAGPLFASTTGAQIPVDGGNDRVI